MYLCPLETACQTNKVLRVNFPPGFAIIKHWFGNPRMIDWNIGFLAKYVRQCSYLNIDHDK